MTTTDASALDAVALKILAAGADQTLRLGSLLRYAVDLTLQAMDKSMDGCEGGYSTDRTCKAMTEIEQLRDQCDYLAAWLKCEAWLDDHYGK